MIEDRLAELLRPRPLFDPEAHRGALIPLLRELHALDDADPRTLDRIVRKYPRGGKGLFSRSQIIAGFRAFAREEGWEDAEARIVGRLRSRGVRTRSGVAPVTVLTHPYPCPGRCIFCPADVRMPRSYLVAEPGAQRAAQNRFDPYEHELVGIVEAILAADELDARALDRVVKNHPKDGKGLFSRS